MARPFIQSKNLRIEQSCAIELANFPGSEPFIPPSNFNIQHSFMPGFVRAFYCIHTFICTHSHSTFTCNLTFISRLTFLSLHALIRAYINAMRRCIAFINSDIITFHTSHRFICTSRLLANNIYSWSSLFAICIYLRRDRFVINFYLWLQVICNCNLFVK